MSKTRLEPIRFTGGPTRLSAALRLPKGDLPARLVHVELTGTAGRMKVRPVSGTDPSISILKLRLPRNTPPGSYEGTAQVGDSLLPIVAQVNPQTHLRLFPGRLMIKAGAGATVHTDLTTANVGNVPVNVQANHTFCIFDGTGIDRAFFTSLTEDRSDGKKRVDRLLDGLAGAHGGLVRLQVEKGSGDIAPGDIRELHVVLRFPHELHPGQSYSGVWSISTSNYYVQIEVTETASGEEVR